MSDDQSITTLFNDAHADGVISQASFNLLAPVDYNDQLRLAMGIAAADVGAVEVTIVTNLVDSSVSMEPMANEARAGHQLMLDTLKGSKQADGVLMACWTFASDPVYPYTPLPGVPKLDASRYAPTRGNTPLYDAVLKVLGGVVAKTMEFAQNGVPVRSVTAIATDGADNASRHRADDVRKVVEDLEGQETHVVMLIGIDDGTTDFRTVGRAMGIRTDRILTVGNSPTELRRAVHLVSQSALMVSQAGMGTISQVGFGDA